jgi:restriction endonuclease S subunit
LNYTPYASFILRIRCGKSLNNRYAFYLLNFLREIEYFTKNIAQQVNFKINATVFREISIPVPPISEQDEIENILDLIYYQLIEVESRISDSKSLQKSLINQIF